MLKKIDPVDTATYNTDDRIKQILTISSGQDILSPVSIPLWCVRYMAQHIYTSCLNK